MKGFTASTALEPVSKSDTGSNAAGCDTRYDTGRGIDSMLLALILAVILALDVTAGLKWPRARGARML
jgi:hypothetical protein